MGGMGRCRADIQQLQAELPRLWPYAYEKGPAAEIMQLPICGQALEPAQPAQEPVYSSALVPLYLCLRGKREHIPLSSSFTTGMSMPKWYDGSF